MFNIVCACVRVIDCNGEEVVVVEEGEKGATAMEVFLRVQMEAFGFPDDHHGRDRIQGTLCGRSRRSRLHALLLLPLLRLSHLIILYFAFPFLLFILPGILTCS